MGCVSFVTAAYSPHPYRLTRLLSLPGPMEGGLWTYYEVQKRLCELRTAAGPGL